MTRPFRVLLAVSLLVNIFAAGVLGGGLFMLSQTGEGRSFAGVPPRPIRIAGEELPPPDREHFGQSMRQVVEGNDDLVRTAREGRRTAARLFVQPRFDQPAVAAALDRARNADILLRARLEAAAVDFAATLPADKRILLAQGLARGGPLRRPPQVDGPVNKTP